MKLSMIILTAALAVASTMVSAEKPEWAGKGKPTKEQREAMKESGSNLPEADLRAIKERHATITEEGHEAKRGKRKYREGKKNAEDNAETVINGERKKGKHKQRERTQDNDSRKVASHHDNARNDDHDQDNARNGKNKSRENMKELDKGSEQGRAMREEHRKKWWRFWE